MRNKEDNAVQDVTRTNEEAVFEELEIHDNVKASLAHDFILVCIPCGSEPAKARSSWCRKVCAVFIDDAKLRTSSEKQVCQDEYEEQYHVCSNADGKSNVSRFLSLVYAEDGSTVHLKRAVRFHLKNVDVSYVDAL